MKRGFDSIGAVVLVSIPAPVERPRKRKGLSRGELRCGRDASSARDLRFLLRTLPISFAPLPRQEVGHSRQPEARREVGRESVPSHKAEVGPHGMRIAQTRLLGPVRASTLVLPLVVVWGAAQAGGER